MLPSSNIKVIIKSPAHRCEDQTIVCNLEWTVSKLKTYISENISPKPAVAEQRLIHSGHLLRDDHTLEEIFQPTEQDNSTFTVHLVLSPKNDKEPSHASIDRSPVVNNSTNRQSDLNSPNLNISQISFNYTTDFTNLYVQQMQQYQQMYVNYMTQFLNQNNNVDQPQQSNAFNLTNSSPLMMNPVFFNPMLTVPNLTDFSSFLINSNSNLNNSGVAQTDDGVVTNRSNNETTNENVDLIRPPNNDQNDVDMQNNGWLDMMHIFWNLLILWTLLSASFSRAIFVLSVAFIYYLYQSGFFSNLRIRLTAEPNNEEQIQRMMDNRATPDSRRRER